MKTLSFRNLSITFNDEEVFTTLNDIASKAKKLFNSLNKLFSTTLTYLDKVIGYGILTQTF